MTRSANIDQTLKAEEFRKIFQSSLRIIARSMSVKTLLSERNLKRIDYSPYYQRNYVWDKAKQTFFIESVILGTEVPPLILFKMGAKIEVIDGRQRFETLKRFKENILTLSIKGLKELQVLNKQSFNKLSDVNKDTFLTSNIRVFEFEVINHPNLTDEIIDRVKKEIFRRYNTGITPLTRDELDNAKYDSDEFSDLFKNDLKHDFELLENFNKCFFPKENVSEKGNNDGLISKNIDLIRRFRILYKFPISTYARGSNRTEIIDLLYDFAQNNTEDVTYEYIQFKSTILTVLKIFNKLTSLDSELANKYIYECLWWAITILQDANIEFEYDLIKFKNFYSGNIDSYSQDNSHYYGSIIKRFENTSQLFEDLFNYEFSSFIRNSKFKEQLVKLRQTEEDSAQSIQELSNLRLHKPNPTSTPIDEIRNDLKTTRYLLRPSYQRQEKINELKASALIESILLGINLPPLFIFKRKNKVKEVVDGQQRLLSIIGFLGDQFHNEDGKLTYSKNNNFKLKGLRVLTDLEGRRFSELSDLQQDKILDFVVDSIIIEEDMNEGFDEVDLFIRLNYKPYPIKANSFEMWNSIVDPDVVKSIKDVTNAEHINWFFLRERKEGRPDRMYNEELITVLSYIHFKFESEDVIGFFPRQDRITCRLKDKKGLSDFLIELDNTAIDKKLFLQSIHTTKKMISNFGLLFHEEITKDILNDFLNVKKAKTYKRSLQDFYVIWLVLCSVSPTACVSKQKDILLDIQQLLVIVKNTNDDTVDNTYFANFEGHLREIQGKYRS
ncbi:DUF262 domain-containing protein [Fulvivirga ligni]|uniref:DUF262 domain-containing protein n=1 Tax=Fulvivirga ligni TaxID=2904246 RepID=UPI001F27D85E|nr:DUF262 domain-containing protein [Fulvivirga ligni]UII22700.1 DUF262 domain-containing protein [Fulvivirga ligni]